MFGFHLTRSRRNFSAIYYGIIPSNLLAFEAAARVRAKQGAGSMERRGSRRGLGIRVRIGIGGSEDKGRLPLVVERASSGYAGHGGSRNGTARRREGFEAGWVG